MSDAGPVRGTAILRPHGYAVWDAVRTALDERIRASGHSNVYFPLLLPMSFLAREAAHVEGFAKECAVVTHHRLRAVKRSPNAPPLPPGTPPGLEPDPEAKLAEPVIIRPTSETVIWDAFSRWVRSHRDLPLLYNQWANVVRWEMRTRPFLRTSEFLWQEGHTAHATREEAVREAEAMAAMYADVAENVLAMPVTRGAKSASERFAGADETLTCEAIMQNGWALQSATSHFLGQNFARAFNVTFTTPTGARELVWATSWGASTRLVGGVIMTHSDDTGLVLPPAIAPTQVVLVPIVPAKAPDTKTRVMDACTAAAAALRAAGVRCTVDDDTDTPPGARYFKWERKVRLPFVVHTHTHTPTHTHNTTDPPHVQGVSLRLEVGARDLERGEVTMRPRTGGVRASVRAEAGVLVPAVQAALAQLQTGLLDAARARRDALVRRVETFAPLAAAAREADAASGAGAGVGPAPVFIAPWADNADNEARVKADTKYTLRCYPAAEQATLPPGARCFFSGAPATHVAMFARAF